MNEDKRIKEGESHTSSRHGMSGQKTISIPKSLLWAVAVIILMGLSFAGGVSYQKKHQPVAATSLAGGGAGFGFGGGGGGGGFRNAAFGAITAVSSSSITINDVRSGSTKTFAITSSTTISSAGTAVSASSLSVGQTVVVRADPTTTTNALSINVLPAGGFGGGASSSSGSTTTQ